MASKTLWVHDTESLGDTLERVYGTGLTVVQAQEVSALRERSHGSVRLRMNGPGQGSAFLHWSRPTVKNLLKEDLREFSLPLQMWVRGQGFEVPLIWCTKGGEYLWHRDGLVCFLESSREGGPVDEWSSGQCETMGGWIGRLHRSIRGYTPRRLRTLQLNLHRIHERWTKEAPGLLGVPFKKEDDPREEIRNAMLDLQNFLDGVVGEFSRTQARLPQGIQQCIHGDLNSGNILWTSGGKRISGVIDWKASRVDARLVDLLRPTRDHILPEGPVESADRLSLLESLVGSYCVESGPFSLEEANLFIPTLILMDLSFLVWQLKQPVYPERALAKLKDIPELWAIRHGIAEAIMEAGRPPKRFTGDREICREALPRRIELFPYSQSEYRDHYRQTLFDADAIVVHLPSLNRGLALEFASQGIKPLAYVSLAKVPVLDEVAPGTDFLGGSPSHEEAASNPFWSAVQVQKDRHDVARTRDGKPRRTLGKMRLKEGWVEACVHAHGYEDRVVQGIQELLGLGFSGLFIDNVIDRLPCCAPDCPGKGADSWEAQRLLLSRIRTEVKALEPGALIIINAGRRFLLNPFPVADIVMVESFGFGDADFDGQKEAPGLRLASRRYEDEEEFVEFSRAMADRLMGAGARPLAYTKVSRHYTRPEIEKRLELGQKLAARSGFLWTTRLKRYTTGKPWRTG